MGLCLSIKRDTVVDSVPAGSLCPALGNILIIVCMILYFCVQYVGGQSKLTSFEVLLSNGSTLTDARYQNIINPHTPVLIRTHQSSTKNVRLLSLDYWMDST